MRKRIYAIAIAGILILVQAVAVLADSVHVVLDGFLLETSQPITLSDGRAMIDVQEATMLFGDDVLGLETIIINGRDMLLLREVANATSLGIIWDDENNLVRLSSASPDYSMLPQLSGDRAQATIRMSHHEALSRINNRDARLISMEENVIIVERELREIEDYLRDNQIRGRGRNYTVAEVQRLRQREAIRNQQQSLEINEKLIREGNELQLRNALADVARTELDIVMLQEQLYLEERNITIVELLHSLGMESNAGLRDAEASLERTRTNLENLRISLGSDHLALNSLLGLPSTAIVEITDLSWATGARPLLEGHVSAQRTNAPNVALLQLDLSFAEYVYHSYDVLLMRNEQDDDYRYRGRRQDASIVIEMRNDIAAAQRAIENAGNSLESRIRALYNDIEALREQQVITEHDLAVTVADYQEVALRYITGMATRLELERAKLAILSHEVTLARHEVNLGMLTLMYQRPYLN